MAENPHILADNILENATVSGVGFTQHLIYKNEYATDLSRASKWQGGSDSATQRLVWTLVDGARNADTFVFDRNSDIAGTGSQISLQHGPGPQGPWTTATLAGGGSAVIVAPSPDEIYWKALSPLSCQYWSLLLEGLDLSQRPPSIFNLWLGERIELAFGPYGDFDPYEEEVIGESLHGAAGAFQWTQRFRRRVLRAGFENLTECQYQQLGRWWNQAAKLGKNWWWLSFPSSEPGDPLYLNCEGHAHRFAIASTVRHGTIEAWEVI